MKYALALIVLLAFALTGKAQIAADESPFERITIEATVIDLNTVSSFDQSINFSGYDLELAAQLKLNGSPYFIETGFYGNVSNALTKRFNWDIADQHEAYYLVGTQTQVIEFNRDNFSEAVIEGTQLSEQSGIFIGVGKSIFRHEIMSLEPVIRLGIRNVNFTMKQNQYLKEIGANPKEVRSLYVITDNFAPTLSLDLRAKFRLEELFDFGVLVRYQYMSLSHDVVYSDQNGATPQVFFENTARTHYHMLNVGLTIGIGI